MNEAQNDTAALSVAAAPVENDKPAIRLLDQASEELNKLGSYAVSQVQPILDELRALL